MATPRFLRGNIVSVTTTQNTGTVVGIYYQEPCRYVVEILNQDEYNTLNESELQLIDGSQVFPEIYAPKINDVVQFNNNGIVTTGTITSFIKTLGSSTIKVSAGDIYTIPNNSIQPFLG